MMAAYALLAAPTIARSYNVAAILVSPRGEILSYGVNLSYVNFTRHAEVNALQGCLRNGRAIPAQSTLYTTLQPCQICAGMIEVSMHQGRVIYSVGDTHYNGQSGHMHYHTVTPMHELTTIGKPLTTWTTGRAYDKITGQKEHVSLGNALNQHHQSIESPQQKRYSIIQYLNNEGRPASGLGSGALIRKKEKYDFGRVELFRSLNSYVDQALLEVTSFLEALAIPLKTVPEERVEQAVALLQHHYPTRSAELWKYVAGELLVTVRNGHDLDAEVQEIAQMLHQSPFELEYKASLSDYRGVPLYS